MENNNKEIKRIYFLGIGGIGMSAQARYFNKLGAAVFGYDKTATKLTDALQAEGIKIHFEDDPQKIPKELDIAVYTPAIPKNNKEFQYLENQKDFRFIKRAKMLGEITHNQFTIAVAGSHGKTTISAMLSHVLINAGMHCTAFIGGISQNYETNFLEGNGKVEEKNRQHIFIVEADEYDRSFHHLYPDIAVITAIDDDHLEIYGNHANLLKSFEKFIENIKQDGSLFMKKGLKTNSDCLPEKVCYYHLSEPNLETDLAEQNEDTANIFTRNIQIADSHYRFDTLEYYTTRSEEAETETLPLILNLGGKHNIENCLPVVGICKSLGLSHKEIADGLATFKGIKRRFEYVLRQDVLTIIDDYAHHPEELRMLLISVRELFPSKKISIIFQPHLFSRTKNLASYFANALSLADEVLLMTIYPARELPMEGVTSHLIGEHLDNTDGVLYDKKTLLQGLENRDLEVLVIAGAGDIGEMVEKIKEKYIIQ